MYFIIQAPNTYSDESESLSETANLPEPLDSGLSLDPILGILK